MTDSEFWRHLIARLWAMPGVPKIHANWTPEGPGLWWFTGGPSEDYQDLFGQGAVRLGHPGGDDAWSCWLDRLRYESPAFRGSGQIIHLSDDPAPPCDEAPYCYPPRVATIQRGERLVKIPGTHRRPAMTYKFGYIHDVREASVRYCNKCLAVAEAIELRCLEAEKLAGFGDFNAALDTLGQLTENHGPIVELEEVRWKVAGARERVADAGAAIAAKNWNRATRLLEELEQSLPGSKTGSQVRASLDAARSQESEDALDKAETAIAAANWPEAEQWLAESADALPGAPRHVHVRSLLDTARQAIAREGATLPVGQAWVSQRIAASYLGVKARQIQDLVKTGRLEARGPKGKRRISTVSLTRYLPPQE
jgi:hypothetical protein